MSKKQLDISSHTAHSLHAHPACAVPTFRHAEYFADHARADRMLFDGVLDPKGGSLHADLGTPAMGLERKESHADRYAVA